MRRVIALALAAALTGCGTLATIACPASPRHPESPISTITSPPMGTYPVWFNTFDRIKMSELLPAMPPYDGGSVRKNLVFLNTDFTGDLTLTGRQLDGDSTVLFITRATAEIPQPDGSAISDFVDGDLTDRYVIEDAQVTSHWPNPPGYAQHWFSPYYPTPGCYELTGEFGGLASSIFVNVIDG